MIKRILIIACILALFPLISFANGEEGLVPCGPGTGVDCQLCHLFVIFGNVVDFLMTRLIPAAAIILIIYGGIMTYVHSANPEGFSYGKKVILMAIAGVFIAYTAWIIIGLILQGLGMVEDWGFHDWWQSGLYTIECPVD